MRYQFAWLGRTPKDFSTTMLEGYPEEAWDNFVSVKLIVICSRTLRVLQVIDLEIDDEHGWTPQIASEKIHEAMNKAEEVLRDSTPSQEPRADL